MIPATKETLCFVANACNFLSASLMENRSISDVYLLHSKTEQTLTTSIEERSKLCSGVAKNDNDDKTALDIFNYEIKVKNFK